MGYVVSHILLALNSVLVMVLSYHSLFFLDLFVIDFGSSRLSAVYFRYTEEYLQIFLGIPDTGIWNW
jgi:hypothetical protein